VREGSIPKSRRDEIFIDTINPSPTIAPLGAYFAPDGAEEVSLVSRSINIWLLTEPGITVQLKRFVRSERR